MKCLIIAVLLVVGAFANASPWIAGQVGFRNENDSETGNMSIRNTYGFLLGHRWSNQEVFLEFSSYSLQTGNPTLTIARKNQIFFGGYRYYPFDSSKGFTWYPYISAGVGGTRDVITTTLLGQSIESESKLSFVGAAGVGVWGLIIKHFRAGGEIRILSSQEFNPKVMFDLNLRVGYEY